MAKTDLARLRAVLGAQAFALVSVGEQKGSVPRETGAWMAVTSDDVIGTIGGGHLEWEAIAHARAVIDLCSLAGQPQMAGRFLEEDVGLDDVRNRLLAAKAEATPDITAAHAQPGRAATTNPWGEVIARTFKTKG